MATNSAQEAWFKTAPGRAVDPDHVAGLQCVDVPKDYFTGIFNRPWQDGWPGAGNAQDMDSTFSTNYFTWIRNDPNNPNLIPQRGDIIVWDGTAPGGPNPYGHIAVCLDADVNGVTVIQQDGFLQVPMYIGRLGYYNNGTGMASGWLRPKVSIAAPTPPAASISPKSRKVAAADGVRERSGPSTTATILNVYDQGTVLDFKGFVRKELVNGSNIWFVGAYKGNYFHISGFADQSTHDLTDLTATLFPPIPTLASNQRRVGSSGVTLRSAADKNAGSLGALMPGRVVTMKGWVDGTDPYGDGNRTWFVTDAGAYAWSGGFEDKSRGTLPQIAPPAPPVVTKPYTFTGDFATVNGIKVEVLPADIGNVDVGNFPVKPEKIVDHWWNKPEAKPSIEGVISQFRGVGNFVSAHFVVSTTRIIQMVSLKDRAYHAGAGGNGWIGIEVDPRAALDTAEGEAIRQNVRALHTALRDKYGYRHTLTLHKNVPGASTDCSGLDLTTLELDYGTPPPVVTPPTTQPPGGVDLPKPDDAIKTSVLREFFEWLISLFINRQK